MEKTVKYLIVGQGLAGSVLAHLFRLRNVPFMVQDEPSLSSSSKVAAGLFNPVVFKRLTTGWRSAEAQKACDTFYNECGKYLGKQLIVHMPVVKFFGEEQERTFWKIKAAGELKHVISEETHTEPYRQFFFNPYGYSRVMQSGIVDVSSFLSLTAEWLAREKKLIHSVFRHHDILQGHPYAAEGVRFEKIIFCEGYRITENPFFRFVRMKPAKGETLLIECPGLELDEVVNKGVYIIPAGDNRYRVGATYEWTGLNDHPTLTGKRQLISKLEEILALPFRVIEHKAGVRPSVEDRRPVLGPHPEDERLIVFNGLGTKGVLLAPYCARILLEFLLKGKEIEKEISVSRFF